MKTKIKISKRLRAFLKNKGVLKEFLYNSEHHSLCEHSGICRVIGAAFIFDYTIQGKDFWKKFDREFKSIEHNNITTK